MLTKLEWAKAEDAPFYYWASIASNHFCLADVEKDRDKREVTSEASAAK